MLPFQTFVAWCKSARSHGQVVLLFICRYFKLSRLTHPFGLISSVFACRSSREVFNGNFIPGCVKAHYIVAQGVARSGIQEAARHDLCGVILPHAISNEGWRHEDLSKYRVSARRSARMICDIYWRDSLFFSRNPQKFFQ